MKQYFKIHGDNIVECERIVSIILSEIHPTQIKKDLLSPSTEILDLSFVYGGTDYTWHIDLLPGFNKSGRSRWEADIFDSLRKNGNFLNETPDAIITEISGSTETILCAIEFCSALQAGNQAWQRSGRAFSTGRTGCPYLYIVDFVKYELDPNTRERKNLRFPNAAVPYSYINFSRVSGNFVAQVYVKSESFDKSLDSSLRNFNENDFAEEELRKYIVKKMARLSTSTEEIAILKKNFEVVCFLAGLTSDTKNLSVTEWRDIFYNKMDVVDYCVDHQRFNFHKTISQKSMHGELLKVISLIDKYSAGLASKDLPVGIIPAAKRPLFSAAIKGIYPSFDQRTIDAISDSTENLILCVFKGFKPHGDDARPDRGLLPLAAMLSDNDNEIMTILYGPILNKNYELLVNDPETLAGNNGLWKSILSLSNYVLLDAPILGSRKLKDVKELLFTTGLKQKYTQITHHSSTITGTVFSSIPTEFHEDDVDTGIHFMFTEVLKNVCFEGLCNPPGGDWSGISVLVQNKEERWLSLPRVSDAKRPDHLIEITGVFDKPLLLIIESKENSGALEPDVGDRLIAYIRYLMNFVPNVERNNTTNADWKRSSNLVNKNDFIMVSAAAYLKDTAQYSPTVHENSNCDILFIMTPKKAGWKIEAVTYTREAAHLKEYMKRLIDASHDETIEVK